MKSLRTIAICSIFILSGCLPAEIVGQKPNGEKVVALFYPGGTTLDDLLIIGGRNYFGKAQYQIDDPLGDVGFRFKTGERVQAECTQQGKNIIGQPDCKRYTIYRSTFALLPEKTVLLKPAGT
jgi:hypothetical protein